jgi:hypothetical protein
VPYVAFGVKWLDADNDGWLDFMITNGHTADNIAETGQGATFRQPTLFYSNQHGSRFERVNLPALDSPIVGRGLATGDYDNDGRVDAVVADSDGKAILLHNETPSAGHWLSLRLIGKTGNRDAYGAALTVDIPSQSLFRHVHADGSYLSSSDSRVHFGLGTATKADRITIRWPGGAVQTLRNVSADRIVTIAEGLSER